MLSKAQYLKSENFKSCCLLVEDLSIADPELKNAIELSKAIEAFKNKLNNREAIVELIYKREIINRVAKRF